MGLSFCLSRGGVSQDASVFLAQTCWHGTRFCANTFKKMFIVPAPPLYIHSRVYVTEKEVKQKAVSLFAKSLFFPRCVSSCAPVQQTVICARSRSAGSVHARLFHFPRLLSVQSFLWLNSLQLIAIFSGKKGAKVTLLPSHQSTQALIAIHVAGEKD